MTANHRERVEIMSTYREYWTEVEESVDYIKEAIKEAIEYGDDPEVSDIAHEVIFNDQRCIYYNQMRDTLVHTDNEDYYVDNFGAEFSGDTSPIYTIAAWAFYADVMDKCEDLEGFKDELLEAKEATG